MSPHSPKYPNNIRKIIKRHGWSVEEVVEKTGIPRRTLMDYCQGKTPVPRHRLEALAQCLEYATSYLVPPLHISPTEARSPYLP